MDPELKKIPSTKPLKHTVKAAVKRSRNYNVAEAELEESFWADPRCSREKIAAKRKEIFVELYKQCEEMVNATLAGSFMPER